MSSLKRVWAVVEVAGQVGVTSLNSAGAHDYTDGLRIFLFFSFRMQQPN